MNKKPSNLEQLLELDQERAPESPDSLDQEILAYAKQKAMTKTAARPKFLAWAPVLATASVAFVAVLILFPQPQPELFDMAVPKIAASKPALPRALESNAELSVGAISNESYDGSYNDGFKDGNYDTENRSKNTESVLSKSKHADISVLERPLAMESEPASINAELMADDLEEIQASMDAASAEYSVSSKAARKKEINQRIFEEAASAAPENFITEKKTSSIKPETDSNVNFRAGGNEPSWLLEIGKKTVLSLNDDEKHFEFMTGEPVINLVSKTSTYQLQNENHRLIILIVPKDCTDTMSEETFSAQVIVMLDKRKLSGCGRALH